MRDATPAARSRALAAAVLLLLLAVPGTPKVTKATKPGLLARAKAMSAKAKGAGAAKPKRNASAFIEQMSNNSIGYIALDDHMKSVVTYAISSRHIERVILPLFSNLGFMPYLKNLLCSITRLNIENYAVISMDNLMCAALRATGFTQPAEACVSPYDLRPLSDSADQGAYSAYNSLHFWRLVIQRPLWIMWMLQEGYSVLQCDVDIVFLHNPFPALEAPKMRRFDALFQSEQVYGINCGFYFVRPTNATRRFMQMWLDDMIGPKAHHVVHGGKMHEQHSFVRINQAAKSKGFGFASRKLNESQFPNGKIWYNYWHITGKRTAYIIHCNWNKMNKKSRLRRDNLWFLEEDESTCRKDFDPAAEQCQRNCIPVKDGCAMGKPCKYRTCEEHTDYVKKVNARNARKGVSVPDLWHPMASRYACNETHRL